MAPPGGEIDMEMVFGALIAFAVEVLVIALFLGWKPVVRRATRRIAALHERRTAVARWHPRPPRPTT